MYGYCCYYYYYYYYYYYNNKKKKKIDNNNNNNKLHLYVKVLEGDRLHDDLELLRVVQFMTDYFVNRHEANNNNYNNDNNNNNVL